MGREERAGEETRLAEAEKGGGNKEGWRRGRGLQWRAGLSGSEPMG